MYFPRFPTLKPVSPPELLLLSDAAVALWPGTSKDFFLLQLLDLLTLGLWSKVGRLTHYAFDAVLSELSSPMPRLLVSRIAWLLLHDKPLTYAIVSAFLAGMKRSTGLT